MPAYWRWGTTSSPPGQVLTRPPPRRTAYAYYLHVLNLANWTIRWVYHCMIWICILKPPPVSYSSSHLGHTLYFGRHPRIRDAYFGMDWLVILSTNTEVTSGLPNGQVKPLLLKTYIAHRSPFPHQPYQQHRTPSLLRDALLYSQKVNLPI